MLCGNQLLHVTPFCADFVFGIQYVPFSANHYTHEIVILGLLGDYIAVFGGVFKLFSLQLQFPCSSNKDTVGVSSNYFRCSYSFLVLQTRIQLEEIIPLSDFQSLCAITVLGVLSHHLTCEMKSLHLVDFC